MLHSLRALFRGWTSAPLVAAAAMGLPSVALGAPLSKDAQKGLDLAKSGDCVGAVPLLEATELHDHRPATAAALAGCEAALGELVLARDIYRSLADEKPQKSWSSADKKAHEEAEKKADALDERIPTVEVAIDGEAPAELEIRIGDKAVELGVPAPVPPDEKVKLEAKAPGFEDHVETVLLHEGERKRIRFSMTAEGHVEKPPKPPPPSDEPVWWLGARFRGYIIPTFLMNLAADGGTTVYEPGAGFTLTRMFGRVEVTPSIAYTYYGMPAAPFKPHDAPDTEWEIVESNLHSLALSVDIVYGIPLDASGVATFRIGGGIGLGAMVAGDLVRTQAYPRNGKAGDPYTYKKCKAPNDPAGTFRYCNALDKDKTRYGEADRAWGDGGARPIIYPWLALPELGFAFKPSKRFAIDVEVAATLSGFLTGVGLRYGL